MSRAAEGLGGWLLQRFTAVYLAVYLLAVVARVLIQGTPGYAEWRSWFALPWMGVLTVMFAIAVLLHAWIGVREVLIDYVHPVGLRLVCMAVTGLVLLGSLLWVVRALTLAAVPGAA